MQLNVRSADVPIESLYIDLPLLLTYDPHPDSLTTEVQPNNPSGRNSITNVERVKQSARQQIFQLESTDVEHVHQQFRDSFTDALRFDRSPIRHLLQQPEPKACKIGSQLTLNARLVIVGDPGCGKTTLLHFLAYRYACRNPLLTSDTEDATSISANQAALPNQPWIPITLVCRDLLATDFECSLSHLIEYQLQKLGYIANDVQLLTDLIGQKMSEGQVLLLVDGLDEIQSSRKRQQFAQLIANIHEPIPIVLTSRVVGFSTVVDSLRSFKHINVSPLGVAEKKEFSQNFAKSWGDTSITAVYLESFVCSDRRVATLCENIFLLSLITQLALQEGISSRYRRVDFYHRTVDLMIKRRPILDDRRDSKPNNEILPHLQYLAYQMRLDGAQYWQESQVIDAIEEFYVNKATSRMRRYPSEDWLDLVLKRIGLLTIAGTSMRDEIEVQFFHQSFQEYFAAQALMNSNSISAQVKVLQQLQQLVHGIEIAERKVDFFEGRVTKTEPVTAGYWQEVIRFCIGSLPHRKDNQSKVNEINADDAMLMLLPSPLTADREARALSIFALQTLVEEPDVRGETIDTVIDAAIDNLNRLDGHNTKQNTLMDEVLYSLMRSCFAERCRKRMLQSFIQSCGSRRSRIGAVYSMATTSGDVLNADNAVEILEPLLRKLQIDNSIEIRADAALKLTDAFYRVQTLVSSIRIDFLPDALLPKIVSLLLETAKGSGEHDAISFASLCALGWLTSAKVCHTHTAYRFTEEELKVLRQIVTDDKRDAYSRMWAALILSVCGTETLIFNQVDDWIMQWATVADGRKAHRDLPTITPIHRPQDTQALDSLITSNIPENPKRLVAIAMGRLGYFIPVMIEPLLQVFQDDLLTDEARDEALVYLTLIGGKKVISFLTQVIKTSTHNEGDE
ncbi:MAG: NACHT domain-containing protein [Cyanobacteria bacterium P01_H01_bin.105]